MQNDFENLFKKAHKIIDDITEGVSLGKDGVKSANETMEKVRTVLSTVDTPEKQAVLAVGFALIATVFVTDSLSATSDKNTSSKPEQK